MRLDEKITMTDAQLGELGRDAMDLYVAGLDTKEPLVIASYLGTLMYMCLANINQNMDLQTANAVMASVSAQWERNHAAD